LHVAIKRGMQEMDVPCKIVKLAAPTGANMPEVAFDGVAAFPVVGIGASAGGLRALESFFRATSPAPGMAFVVVMHLAPDKPSLLAEILSRHTAMRVEVARDGQLVEKDKVYVLPPNAILTISEGILRLQATDAAHHQRSPIDVFFSALAHDRREYAVGIVLSGSGSDGVLGVKAIKTYGGITIAQAKDSSGPGFASMPESAIATGLVDFAIPTADMPARLSEIVLGFGQGYGQSMEEPPLKEEMAVTNERDAIYAILLSQTGHDFSGYKIRTFMRRVHRRMQIHLCVTLRDYVQLLRHNANEATLLFRDLLINVTSFFRDAEAFEVLGQTAIPHLFEGKTAADWVRVWAPGCSTGEEAISIAIMLREFMDTLPSPPRVTVFATDIDEAALAAARAARYPERLMGGVSPERLQRFFVAQPGAYVVAKAVRDLCVFSPHDVLRDPPFSRMDMISCRNLLIYFDGDAQRRVFPVFHYALRSGGFLFLGQSETIGRFTDLFTALNKTNCVYQSVGAVRPRSMPLSISGLSPGPFAVPTSDRTHSRSGSQLRDLIEARIALLTPPHVVVTGDGEILYSSARTGKYLELPPGVPTRQLVSMAHKDLRLELRSALRQALQTGQTAARENVGFETENHSIERVSLVVEPLLERERGPPEFLVVFKDSGPIAETEGSAAEGEASPDTTHAAAELRDTRLQLQTTIEEYETALEELRLANEQMMSLNEETQSTNEELESSKEELQSLNEEMQTVNQEILGKVEDLDRANRELRNVFINARIATVFLDRNLAIRSFTPPIEKLFNVIMTDIGRPLTDLVNQLDYQGLRDDLHKVLRTGVPLELSVRTKKDAPQYFLARLTPSYDSSQAIDGVVATFIDAPALDRAEGTIQTLYAERLEVVQAMAAGLAHEINQPLAAVSISLETLRRMLAMPPQDRADSVDTVLDRAFQQTLRAGRIISDLRTFIAQNEPNKTIFHLHDLIREVSDEFKADPRRDNLRVTLKLAVGDDRVLADMTQIDQVLVNLMQNAHEAMTVSSRCELTIRTAAVENSMIRIDVADTGAGIAEDMASKVFEPFHSTKKRGMGIGLPISRKIIEAHRGKIWLRPNPGGGAVFSFTVPLAEIDDRLGSSPAILGEP
jgi:two-component system CheB/CheR fusion protein